MKTRKKVVTSLIVILYERDVLLLSKHRLVYLANVMMPRANEDIPTSVRAQEFLPGIVWTPVNRVLHSNSIHEKKEKKGGGRSESHGRKLSNSDDSSSVFNGSHGDNIYRDNGDDDGCNRHSHFMISFFRL